MGHIQIGYQKNFNQSECIKITWLKIYAKTSLQVRSGPAYLISPIRSATDMKPALDKALEAHDLADKSKKFQFLTFIACHSRTIKTGVQRAINH